MELRREVGFGKLLVRLREAGDFGPLFSHITFQTPAFIDQVEATLKFTKLTLVGCQSIVPGSPPGAAVSAAGYWPPEFSARPWLQAHNPRGVSRASACCLAHPVPRRQA